MKNNIRELREKNGMTQKELADKINVSKVSIGFWENDRVYPNILHVVNMAKLFNVSINSIYEIIG